MYFFGIAALDRFKTRLKDYPQYCQHVSCIPHFKDFPAHLVEWVEFGAQSQVPPNKPQGPVVPPQPLPVGSAAVSTTSKVGPSAAPGAISAPGPPGSSLSGPAVSVAPPASTAAAGGTPAAAGAATSSTIVRPTVSTIGGRPSIANTTNIDTLLNAKQKSGPQVTRFAVASTHNKYSNEKRLTTVCHKKRFKFYWKTSYIFSLYLKRPKGEKKLMDY